MSTFKEEETDANEILKSSAKRITENEKGTKMVKFSSSLVEFENVPTFKGKINYN